MQNIRKILIAIIIAIIIIIIIVALMIFYLNKGRIMYGIDETENDLQYEIEDKIKRVDTKAEYFAIENCINKYYIYYAGMYNTEEGNYIIDEEAAASMKEEKTENANALYNILAQEYIEAKQITKSNISTKFKEIQEAVVSIKDMYKSEQTENITIYIVYGNIREKQSGKITNYQLIIKQDGLKRTFAVLPSDYVQEKYKTIEIGQTINIEVPKEITENSNNQYDIKPISEEEYVNKMISQLKEDMIYNPEVAYEKLDETYKNKKASSINEFKTYAKNNIKNYIALKVQKYQKTEIEQEGYTRYILIDTEGRYHILQETAPMKYTMMLDTYWIDIPEFVTKYDNSNPQERVILDLNKFMQALNDKDYKYAYSVLADSFKQNNFRTEAEFEAYAKTNFFEKNEFTYEKFGSEANTYYTYQIKVTDKTKAQNKEITKTFIVLLEERKRLPVII